MAAPSSPTETPSDPVARVASIFEETLDDTPFPDEEDAPESKRAVAKAQEPEPDDDESTKDLSGGGPEVDERQEDEALDTDKGDGASSEPDEDKDELDGVQSFAELAGALDMEEDALADHLTVKGPDGKDVTLATALREYRNQPAATEAAEQYEAQASESQAQHADRTKILNQEWNRAVSLTKRLISELKGSEPDWRRLREDDPDQYVSQREAWLAKEEMVKASMSELEDAEKASAADADQELLAVTQRELVKLHRAKPEWRDAELATKDFNKMREYLFGMNMTEVEVDAMTDSRVVMIVWDALAGSAHKKSRPKALARIAKAKEAMKAGALKPVGPSARRSQSSKTATITKTAKERLKKTGSLDDAAKVFEGMI